MIDIILFAGIAAFIGFRLYQVLGKKDFEAGKTPAPATPPAPEKVIDATYVVVKPVVPAEDESKLDEIFGKEIAVSIRNLKKLDPSFSGQAFISGAKKAFEIILKAFASGNRETLQPLLGKDVYKAFSAAIDERAISETVFQTTLVAIASATIKDITVNNKYVRIAVNIVSEQIHLVKDKQGKVVQGNPSQIDKINETWTFGRDINSTNPTWELVETAAA